VLALRVITLQKKTEEELIQSYKRLKQAMDGTVQAMAFTIETRDPYTAGHQRRVTQLACALAEKMALPEDVIAGVRMAGDLHDIGKNLVGMMCRGAGFQVKDIGISVEPEAFVEAVKEFQPDIVGMSALLTTTMRAMGDTIKALEEAGVRDSVKIMVGGAPVTKSFAEKIGANGYASNAAAAADLAKKFVAPA